MLFVNRELMPEHGPHVSALDRGFTLGDGVFETMRAAGRHVYRWEAHLARLRTGARLLDLPLEDLDIPGLLADALERAALPQAVVRLTVTRGPDRARGVAVSPGLRPTVVVRVLPLAPPPAAPVRAVLAATRRNERSPLSRVKSLSYGDSVVAWLEAQRRGADDALLCNTRGLLAGATTSNLFAVLDGTLVTPPVSAGALPGTARAFVLSVAGTLAPPAREGDLRPRDLLTAEEAFLTNAVLGVRPLVAVEGVAIGSGRPGRCAAALRAAWEEAWAAFVEQATS